MSILLLCAVTGSIAHARTDALKLVEQTIEITGERLSGSKSGRVYRLTPPYTRPEVLVTLEDYPHSVALRGDEMLIAETNGLYRTFYRPGQARILPQDVK